MTLPRDKILSSTRIEEVIKAIFLKIDWINMMAPKVAFKRDYVVHTFAVAK